MLHHHRVRELGAEFGDRCSGCKCEISGTCWRCPRFTDPRCRSFRVCSDCRALAESLTVNEHDVLRAEQIGAGAFGAVYRGICNKTEVALKYSHESNVRRAPNVIVA